MRVYVDTGIFIDYLSGRGFTETGLRSAGRRGRPLQQLLGDAERTLTRVGRHHEGATSALTFYEVEEALYRSLAASRAGVAHADRFRVAFGKKLIYLINDRS
ncbi:MAG: hypothetical protein ACR2JC_17250 [Chloroflexota bacterium]|nr:MAG: hypothetical protein DLM70_11330 [Chloroflexota bacterium]